ncbi:hypothetical protein HYV70_03015 [Candidatus Uhrbacteria bacterium]|nr:hypothetical protein [Candidatus Uhrbacteria bacterium]
MIDLQNENGRRFKVHVFLQEGEQKIGVVLYNTDRQAIDMLEIDEEDLTEVGERIREWRNKHGFNEISLVHLMNAAISEFDTLTNYRRNGPDASNDYLGSPRYRRMPAIDL